MTTEHTETVCTCWRFSCDNRPGDADRDRALVNFARALQHLEPYFGPVSDQDLSDMAAVARDVLREEEDHWASRRAVPGTEDFAQSGAEEIEQTEVGGAEEPKT